MILVTGSLWVRPAEKEAALDALRTLQRHARARPGCHAARYAVDIDDPSALRIHEEWEDEQALLGHLATRAYADFLERMGDKLAGTPDVTRWDGASGRALFG